MNNEEISAALKQLSLVLEQQFKATKEHEDILLAMHGVLVKSDPVFAQKYQVEIDGILTRRLRPTDFEVLAARALRALRE